MAFSVDTDAPDRAAAAIQACAHRHCVDVSAIRCGQRPVGAQALALQFQMPCPVVAETLCKTLHLAVQTVMRDEQADALSLPAVLLPNIQVMAYLITLE